jgi:hypothetical protein
MQEKSLPLAIGLNFVLPGLGYMYMGRVIVGIGALLLFALAVAGSGLLFLLPIWLGLNIIMAIDMVILNDKRKKAIAAATLRKCPACAEMIQREAKICRFCHQPVIEIPA